MTTFSEFHMYSHIYIYLRRISFQSLIFYPLILYHRFCLEKYDGQLFIPTDISDLSGTWEDFLSLLWSKGVPSTYTWTAYIAFFTMQILLAAVAPGFTMDGLPTAPHGERLKYHCNGYCAFYMCIICLFFADYTAVNYGYGYDLTHMASHFGEYLVASIIIADVTSLYWYIYGLVIDQPGCSSPTGNIFYDFFMGTVLYPRMNFGMGTFTVDVKMVAEARWSWVTLFLLTLSCATKQFRDTGAISGQLGIMILAHWLYANATVKGEHCIPCTWDMFHEKYGWMLNFWNISGVPFLYCFQSFYVLRNQELVNASFPYNYVLGSNGFRPFTCFLFLWLLLGYYIFDSANGQKAYMKSPIQRNTFPTVPWTYIAEPVEYIVTPKGKLLVDGWYAFARKMQYTGDIMMALCWGMATGFTSLLPYFYALFFTAMITHRQWRDEIRCRDKYGKYWKEYTDLVPNVFLPPISFYMWLFFGGPHPTRDRVKKLL